MKPKLRTCGWVFDVGNGKSEGKSGSKKSLVLVTIVAIILTAGIVYQATAMKYLDELKDKDAALATKDSKIAELQAQLGKRPTPTTATGVVDCTACHALDKTKAFHFVENIKRLDEVRNETPRICTTCHGANPHDVHKRKLDAQSMKCETCHVTATGDFVVPQAPEGKLLVCEACHAFSGKPDDVGNYVSIHIEEAGKGCTICHMGDAIKIHSKATENLGFVEGKIYKTA